MQNGVDLFNDILNGVIKSMVFGVAVTLVALHSGWTAKPTPEGVSRATTRTVVSGSLLRSEERRVGKSVSVRVDLGGRRIITKKKDQNTNTIRPNTQKLLQSITHNI